MIALLDVALSCLARGWFVFPCKPRAKEPLIRGGFHAATNAETQVRDWWTKWPTANVGIATGASGLTVLDIDTGIGGWEDVEPFCSSNGIPSDTYMVRTGRRPGFGVQLYFTGGDLKSIPWTVHGNNPVSGDIRSGSGYVMAAGSVHPSGAVYEALVEAPIAPQPAFVKSLRSAVSDKVAIEEVPITTHRNETMLRLLGRFRNGGADDDDVRAKAVKVNETRMTPPLGEDELERIVGNVCKWDVGEPEVEVVIGKAKATTEVPSEPVDWRTRYLTFEQVRDAKPTEFLIKDFLAVGSITALAAPVAQRKSLIAMNIARALLTGKPLFGYFDVVRKPERVVYLCPEMGVASFSTRLKAMELDSYAGTTLFAQTMDEDALRLSDLGDELPGSVLILDTLTRFVDGDQNSVDQMSKFAKVVFELKRRGATVLLLHHSVKGAGTGLTLDSAMRGSTELAAFVTCCWATCLKDPTDPYGSLSTLVNVKQRDFECPAFEASSDRITGIMTRVGAVAVGGKSEADTNKATQIILDNPEDGILKLRGKLADAGIKKGAKWITALRCDVLGVGVKASE